MQNTNIQNVVFGNAEISPKGAPLQVPADQKALENSKISQNTFGTFMLPAESEQDIPGLTQVVELAGIESAESETGLALVSGLPLVSEIRLNLSSEGVAAPNSLPKSSSNQQSSVNDESQPVTLDGADSNSQDTAILSVLEQPRDLSFALTPQTDAPLTPKTLDPKNGIDGTDPTINLSFSMPIPSTNPAQIPNRGTPEETTVQPEFGQLVKPQPWPSLSMQSTEPATGPAGESQRPVIGPVSKEAHTLIPTKEPANSGKLAVPGVENIPEQVKPLGNALETLSLSSKGEMPRVNEAAPIDDGLRTFPRLAPSTVNSVSTSPPTTEVMPSQPSEILTNSKPNTQKVEAQPAVIPSVTLPSETASIPTKNTLDGTTPLPTENTIPQKTEPTVRNLGPEIQTGLTDLQARSPGTPKPTPDIRTETLENKAAPQSGPELTTETREAFETSIGRADAPTIIPAQVRSSGSIPTLMTPATEQVIAHQTGKQIAQIAQQGPNTPVELALSPEELGRIRLTFTTENGALTVAVATERPETLDLMRRHIDSLAQELRNIGYREVHFGFSQSGQDAGTSDSHPSGQSGTSHNPERESELSQVEQKTNPMLGPQTGSSARIDIRL